ncbi:MAG: hypothetical protein C5B47_04835 [Verrucomicrobia bacterium]|nr:MAG: hypothetical protein C5B47_04835 [Verrucomicrobiota bacterium]
MLNLTNGVRGSQSVTQHQLSNLGGGSQANKLVKTNARIFVEKLSPTERLQVLQKRAPYENLDEAKRQKFIDALSKEESLELLLRANKNDIQCKKSLKDLTKLTKENVKDLQGKDWEDVQEFLNTNIDMLMFHREELMGKELAARKETIKKAEEIANIIANEQARRAALEKQAAGI